MTRNIRYAKDFYEDFERYYDSLSELDVSLAEHAYQAVIKAARMLADFPFIGRRVVPENALVRELLIPFGSTGYVLLYEVDDDETLTVLAVRHQREDDYH